MSRRPAGIAWQDLGQRWGIDLRITELGWARLSWVKHRECGFGDAKCSLRQAILGEIPQCLKGVAHYSNEKEYNSLSYRIDTFFELIYKNRTTK